MPRRISERNSGSLSSKYLKECYQLGAERIGWDKRPTKPGTLTDGEWMVGYGIGCGAFGAYRNKASAKIKLLADGTVNIQSATSDIGPGTATSMTLIAAETLGIGADKITFELGDSSFPVAPTQGGSQTCSSVGSAVHDALCGCPKTEALRLGRAAGGHPSRDRLSEYLETA